MEIHNLINEPYHNDVKWYQKRSYKSGEVMPSHTPESRFLEAKRRTEKDTNNPLGQNLDFYA